VKQLKKDKTEKINAINFNSSSSSVGVKPTNRQKKRAQPSLLLVDNELGYPRHHFYLIMGYKNVALWDK